MDEFVKRLGHAIAPPDVKTPEPTLADTVSMDPEVRWDELVKPRTPDFPVRTSHIAMDPYLPASIVPFAHPDYIRKNVFWNAFAMKAKEAETNHARMGVSLDAFRDAEESPEATAMEFETSGSMTDLETLTDRQRVPDDDGGRVKDQFDESGTVRLDDMDRDAIETANRAARTSRRHPVRETGRHAAREDRERDIAIEQLLAAAHAVHGRCNEFLAANARIRVYQSVVQSEEERGEIARLQATATIAKDAVQTVSDFIAMIVFARTGNPGDAVDKFGTMVATVVGHIYDTEIAEAESRLRALAATIQTDTLRELALELGAKSHALLSAGANLKEAQTRVTGSYAERRTAYQDLGEAVTAAGGGSSPRPGTAIAALPLVENVISKAQALRGESVLPTYSAASGKGFGLVTTHPSQVERAFIVACNEIAGAQRVADGAQQKWRKRLESIVAIKNRVLDRTSEE